MIGGIAVAWVAARVRRGCAGGHGSDDFLGLGLIGAIFGLCSLVGAGGFLAVFFAAVALRQTELRMNGLTPESTPDAAPPALSTPQVGVGALVYKEHLERLSEIALVLLLGGMLFIDSWSWKAVGLALFVFAIVRPLSVLGGLAFTRTPMRMRGMIGWFGVRGIGSLYYLMFAINHGLAEDVALELLHLTLVVVTLSILLHGLSAKPLILRFWRRTAEPVGDSGVNGNTPLPRNEVYGGSSPPAERGAVRPGPAG